MAIAIIAILAPALRQPAPPITTTLPPVLGAPSTELGAPPPLTGSPREQADRLFNRVMTEREAGNLERAEFFLPMAISAYEAAGDLDLDGLYHLSLLQAAAGDYTAALRTAERILDTEPNHLLGLGAAAEAAQLLRDDATARRHFRQLLAALETERNRPLQEYLDHASLIPEYQRAAEEFLRR
jgi:tetratricopeptide (TPR) repeat protein